MVKTQSWVWAVGLALAACDDGTSAEPAPDSVVAQDSAIGDAQADGAEDAVVAPASCEDDQGCPFGSRCERDTGLCRPACVDDTPCGAVARCDPALGYCVPLPACGEDRSCAAGAVCSCRGVCEPTDGTPCQRDLQCAVDAYCDACLQVCRPKVAPCGRCEDGHACERASDVCHPIGPAGLDHCLRSCDERCDNLGPGFECRDIGLDHKVCVPISGDCADLGDCATDIDCPSGRFCNEQGFCQIGCPNDTACPAGQVCQGLRCVPRCAAPEDCGEGQLCDDGHCRIPGGCLTSADCAEAETHCDLALHLCVDGCERDDDCLDATRACVEGACVERGCTGNYQCAFGEVCNHGSLKCEPAPGRHCESGCDPQAEDSCGTTGQRCLSLQDEDGNALGDFCFEPCLAPPDDCPQGYECVELTDEAGAVQAKLCVRRCDLDPYRTENP